MSCANPTARGVVSIRIPDRHRDFLMEMFALARSAVAESLVRSEYLADRPEKWRQLDAYGRLIAAVADGSMILPDREVRPVTERLMESNDHENEYGRAVAEHAAFVVLLDQMRAL